MVTLNETLLNLILFIQRGRMYYIAKSEILGKPIDWWQAVREEWYGVPKKIFEDAGIKQNEFNFEFVLSFLVTDAMMSAQTEELCEFKTPFH